MSRQLDLLGRGAPALDSEFRTLDRRVLSHGAWVEMRLAISAKYGEEFVYTTAALYRDGNDSVAFHGDTTARNMNEALVATVSLGASRRFMMRPGQGGTGESIALPLQGRECRAAIALMFRPKWARNYRTSVDD